MIAARSFPFSDHGLQRRVDCRYIEHVARDLGVEAAQFRKQIPKEMEMADTNTEALYHSEPNLSHLADLEQKRVLHFERSSMSTADKLQNFGTFITRQDVARLSCYLDAIKDTTGVSGSIVECGVYFGCGLMMFAKALEAYEPYNYMCKVVGFDTFSGNVGLSERDGLDGHSDTRHKRDGGYFADSKGELMESIDLYNEDRALSQIDRVSLVEGDIRETAPEYLEQNQHTIVRILSLSLNLYEPTKVALRTFVPRMPQGSLILIWALNFPGYPGTVTSVLEEVGIRNVRIETPPQFPAVNYIWL